ncbi:MAG: ABC transporter ATP-binding protein [Bacillota bacterium]|nr:ABC transporter ATP-binding protein [Candidatus Fermentithermobacillaceae bacterium]HAF66650.1 multidrug ABC transporter ATP-binding protein [Clostridiales bacterium UBA9857]HOA71517.1 ABC transporter ATP-binding protein [Bacillota bacterium]HOP71138.1 ABC transporter ATP-binding protein [Bacillota bacterium]HPT36275.1 ABC transporter ATP-binding protein [Bacillota bacterium]
MRRFYQYLKPFALQVFIILVLVLLQSLAELALPSFMADIVDKGIALGDTALIWRIGGRMLLVAFLGTICAVVSSYMSARVSAAYGKQLRSVVFSHATSLSVYEFDKIGTASLITRTTNDVSQVQMVVLMSMRIFMFAPMMLIGGIMLAYSKEPKLSLLLLAILPILAVLILVGSKKVLPMFKVLQQKLDRLNLVLRENLTGVRVIRAFDRIDYEAGRFDDASRDHMQTALKVYRLLAALMPLMNLIINLVIIGIIWIGSQRIDAGYLEVGGLMAFIQYGLHILMSLIMVSMIFVMIPRASASAARINEVLDSAPEVTAEAAVTAGKAPLDIKGTVEFRNVTFSYPGAEQPAITDISFVAKPGEVTAIIGGTGSGKSTLVNLIPRYFDADQGQILIDGVDIRDIPREELRKHIGLVPQQSVLFSGTVAENIQWGKQDATDEEIRWAAAIAQALEFVEQMPDGFGSHIARGGTNLSGGQKQRLCIARAIVRRPRIYIFDDSFSALDFRTDARVRAALRREVKDATVIVVAQRVSTVMDADKIIVLDNGKIVGDGTHAELLQTCPVYREIVQSQLSEEEIA